jgi:D-beta-D-heptose 7-phosphate kinase/D-beta-D-heptose 1-phosphate adenosyltransferase
VDELAVRAMSGARVLVLGDFFLDRYVECHTLGISPEQPVPRLRETQVNEMAGASGNLAANFASLGAQVSAVGIVGADEAGIRLSSSLEASGIDTNLLLVDPHADTVCITRYLTSKSDEEHHYLRVDSGATRAPAPETIERLRHGISHELEAASALFIADYDEFDGFGLVTRELFENVLEPARRRGVPTFATSRLHPERLTGIDYLLCNRAEFARLGAHLGASEERPSSERFLRGDTTAIAVTRGAEGATLYTAGEPIEISARKSIERDPCGAGDSFAAAFTLATTSGLELKLAGEIASVAGGLAVEKDRTAPILLSELVAACTNEPLLPPLDRRKQGAAQSAQPASRAKIRPLDELTRELDARRFERKVVMTNGCFDVLQPGHFLFLEKAKSLGDILIVALNSDWSTGANKGPGRPLVSYRERAQILAGLECVDYVTVFDELTPIAAIEAIRPDILAKGGNYSIDEIVGKSLVEQYGGQVLALDTASSYDTADFMIAVSRASTGKRDL